MSIEAVRVISRQHRQRPGPSELIPEPVEAPVDVVSRIREIVGEEQLAAINADLRAARLAWLNAPDWKPQPHPIKDPNYVPITGMET